VKKVRCQDVVKRRKIDGVPEENVSQSSQLVSEQEGVLARRRLRQKTKDPQEHDEGSIRYSDYGSVPSTLPFSVCPDRSIGSEHSLRLSPLPSPRTLDRSDPELELLSETGSTCEPEPKHPPTPKVDDIEPGQDQDEKENRENKWNLFASIPVPDNSTDPGEFTMFQEDINQLAEKRLKCFTMKSGYKLRI
jgi:hypothetical protein